MIYYQKIQNGKHTELLMSDYINWGCHYNATTKIYCTVKLQSTSASLSKRHLEQRTSVLVCLSLLVIKVMNMLSVNTRT